DRQGLGHAPGRAGLHRQAAGRRRADRPHQRAARRLTMSRRRHHDRTPGAAPADAERRHDAGPVDPFAILVEYEHKSLAHVAGLPEQLDAPGLWRGVGYRIGQRRLASGFDEVVEILPMPQVTPVPGSQPWMLGVANIRGNLLPTVDLKQFLE